MVETPEAVLVIGHQTSDHLGVRVLGRSHPGATDYWDANWIRCRVAIHAEPFHGEFTGDLRTDELRDLRADFARLYSDLRGTAEYTNLDGHLNFGLKGDGLGHFVMEGSAASDPGSGRILEFRLQLDQTQLPSVIKQIDRILDRFAVVGSPDE